MARSFSLTRLASTALVGLLVCACAHHPREPRQASSTPPAGSPATAVAAAPQPAVDPAGSAQLPIDPLTWRPVVVRHLDAASIEGQTWTFPSSNPQTYRDTRYVFKHGKMDASDVRRHTTGTWTVENDKLCTYLKANDFGTTCYYVTTAPDGSAQILVLPGGDRLPLVVR